MTQPSAPAGASAPTGELTRGELGTTDLLAQSLAVGPITSAALLGGVVAAKGGSAGPLYLLIVVIGILGLGSILVMFARRYTHAGVMYEYVGRTLGPTAGISTAGFYYLAYLILGGPTMLIGAGVLGQDLCQSYLHISVPFWLIALGILLVVAIINLRGVQLSVRAQLTIFVLSVIPYLITAIVVVVKGGAAGNTAQVFDPSAPTAGAFMPTFMFCALLFVGVESSASLGEEAREPSKSVPRAIILTILIVAGFCFLTQYAGTIGFGLDDVAGTWASDPLGLSTLGKMYVGSWISPLLQLGLVLDMVAVAIGFMSASARGMFALSRGGLLPAALGATSRWKTPHVGIVVFAALTVVCLIPIVILSATTGMDPYVGFTIGATFGGLLVMVAYLVLILAAGKLLMTGKWVPAGWIAFALALVTVGAGIIGSLHPIPDDESRYGIYAALTLLILGLAWGCYHGLVRKHKLPELHSTTASLEGEPSMSSHLI
ncbi:amino acid transporter [Mycobacterium frederiksbergense]|uniref:Amino acid transporter n=1 Tax=Mycolicibacterium frederiksbergense TaxID=117567 RepID=A0ABT6KVE1_9MYCO|nr:APC family permease [Mycolicibacterium frederiksbergense]MDH6194679.1 amino acid transporter [Mycolicibacterium frederiksbergense]